MKKLLLGLLCTITLGAYANPADDLLNRIDKGAAAKFEDHPCKIRQGFLRDRPGRKWQECDSIQTGRQKQSYHHPRQLLGQYCRGHQLVSETPCRHPHHLEQYESKIAKRSSCRETERTP